MTIASERSKVVYQGNGSTREFVVPFHYTRTEDLEVVLRGEDGTERILLHGSEYVMQQGEDEYGGTCVLGTAPQPGEALSVRRDPPILQETAYEEGVPLSARARENALDLLTMIAQANRERVDRALMLPVSSTHKGLILPEPEARRTLVWSPDGMGLENGPSIEAVGAAQGAAQTALAAAGDSQAARDAALSAREAAETARDQAQAAAVHEHALLTNRDAPDSHPITAIAGLQAALNGKSATGHTHTVAQITNAGTAATRDLGTAPGNVPVLDAEGKLAESVLPGGSEVVREFITSTQDWTVPSGITEIRVWVIGGGAAGDGINSYQSAAQGGSGGSGGGCAYKVISGLSSGTMITCTIGAAKSGTSGPGTDGNTSSFGAYCSATGGTSYRANAGGGVGVGGDINYRGSYGESRGDGYSGYGGSAGGPWGGAGGNRRTTHGDGCIGQYGGGGGGSFSRAGKATNGGTGSAGLVVIEYSA
ncbi:MAG: hypothetical protein AB7D47_07895 [Desulfovibrio sp.]